MIKQAIIPLAGLGTRLLPLTSVFAKELLPINGKPGLEYIMNECIDAGIKQIIFLFDIMKIICLIPASIHSFIIYSKPGFPLIGKSSFAKTLVKGSNRVPSPARGIIACLII